jgi:hypothetical protein
MAGTKRKRIKGKIRYKPQAVSLARTKVSLGGEWDFTPELAGYMEDMWSDEKYEGTEFQGIRLVRELV